MGMSKTRISAWGEHNEMSKKVGLLTFHRTSNFGSYLQTYGLYRKICDLGAECEIIDYRCPAIEQRESLQQKKWSFHPKKIARQILIQPAVNAKAKVLQQFSAENMRFSPVYTTENIHLANKEYDKFVAGSDIIWGRDITGDDYHYFLDFVTDATKKYAFASSVGDCVIRKDEPILPDLLRDFSKITVRETEAAKWVEEVSGCKAQVVCDPTMLLTEQEWDQAIPTKQKYSNYVLVYFKNPGEKSLADAKAYAKQHGCKVLHINYGIPHKGVTNIKPKTLNEFLSLIKYADMVFTASYHGMLFSLYYEKEFLFYTRAHKSRVLSLAERLGVQANCGDQLDVLDYPSVDYSKVKPRMDQFRDQSVAALTEMLSL